MLQAGESLPLPESSDDVPAPVSETVAAPIDGPWPTEPIPASALRLKRAVDVVFGVTLLAALSPVLLVAIALVWLSSRGPAFFVQQRIGYRGSRFAMLKLRTMVADAQDREAELVSRQPEQTFFKLERDPRITHVGRLLRKFSIDEVPQLLNVIRGDMSLVGPRPLLLSDYEKFPKRAQRRRFSVRPGLTGLWQVSGRSDCTDERRLELDLRYVDDWSLGTDLSILLRTAPAVVSARGAY